MRPFVLSTVQKSELRHRWKAGQSLHEIWRAFGKEHSPNHCMVARHGGILPAVRRRAEGGDDRATRRRQEFDCLAQGKLTLKNTYQPATDDKTLSRNHNFTRTGFAPVESEVTDDVSRCARRPISRLPSRIIGASIVW